VSCEQLWEQTRERLLSYYGATILTLEAPPFNFHYMEIVRALVYKAFVEGNENAATSTLRGFCQLLTHVPTDHD